MVFHVEYPRIIPERKPEGHQPAAPRYTLRWWKPIGMVVSQYHAIQGADLPWDQQREFFDLAEKSLAEQDGASAHEIMRFVDEAGEVNAVVASYWLDATAHARWSARSKLSAWFDSADRLRGQVGIWREAMVVPYDRHETIYSGSGYKIGLARTPDASIESMTTNGYFGAARDRLPLSAIDPFDSPLRDTPPRARQVESKGRRLTVSTPHNMTALRSGQFWVGAQEEQLGDYRENLEPKLMRGMKYLTDHKEGSGTLALRIMTNLDADGKARDETSVLAFFLSLEQLEDWSKSHETHLDIYRHAIAMNRKFKEKREVITWHELFVLQGGAAFEYTNCHPVTGLLPYFDLSERAA